jgi:hypothetical protein
MRTSLYSILCIVVRLGAVFLAFGTLGHLMTVLLSWYQNLSLDLLGLTCAAVFISLLIALLLWVYPGVLARVAAGRSSQQVFETSISASDVQWIALSVLGMYFAMTGLIGLSGYGFNRMIMSAVMDRPLSDERTRKMVSDLLYWMIHTVLGLSLAIGAKGLVGLFHRLRHGNDATLP